jgi:hypothetical protein
MEAVIRLKYSELTPSFLDKLQRLFAGQTELEVAIKTVDDFGINTPETPEEYKKRVMQAIDSLEDNKDVKTLSPSEFENLSRNLLES